MKITYDEIKKDSEKIALEMGRSESEVPSLLSPLKRIALHLVVYFLFSFLSYFLLPEGSDKLSWVGMFLFGLLNWMFIVGFLSGYEFMFRIVSTTKLMELKFVKLIKRKVRNYGFVWLISLAILGGISLTTEMNLGAIVLGNFILSLLGLLIFNVDMARYQLSSVLGAASALDSSLRK